MRETDRQAGRQLGGRKVVQKDRQAVTTRYADCVCVGEGVSMRVCVWVQFEATRNYQRHVKM